MRNEKHMALKPVIKDRRSSTAPAGGSKGTGLAALEQGAKLLQTDAPLKGFDVYVVGFHCPKGEPGRQMEAHHFCKVVNDDLLQCVLFDGNTKDANLIGIEYIVSADLFDTFATDEKSYWHPHNFEVFSGQLVAPGLPKAAEKSLMRHLVNSYGKTWHTWHTSQNDGEPGMDLPYGDPKLMWSFNREGECDEQLKADRDESMGLDTRAKQLDRQSFLSDAKPQYGVNEMKNAFPNSVPIPGVFDINDV